MSEKELDPVLEGQIRDAIRMADLLQESIRQHFQQHGRRQTDGAAMALLAELMKDKASAVLEEWRQIQERED